MTTLMIAVSPVSAASAVAGQLISLALGPLRGPPAHLDMRSVLDTVSDARLIIGRPDEELMDDSLAPRHAQAKRQGCVNCAQSK